MTETTGGNAGSDTPRDGLAPATSPRIMQALLKKVTKDVLRSTVGRAGDALLPRPTKLVILTRGRTGSNLLVSLLKSHPSVRHHGEIFGEYYLQNAFVRNQINKMGSVQYFDWTTRRMLMERVVGVKFLYYQIEDEYAERWKVRNIPAILPVLRDRTDLRIIHLKRRNKLATLVSARLARQSNRYTGGSYDNTKVALSFQECVDEFSRTERWERRYDNAFAAHPCVEMHYEDLVIGTEVEMRRVLELLDLEPILLSSPMRKQNTRPLADRIENFPELKAQFAGTPYAQFFTEPEPG